MKLSTNSTLYRSYHFHIMDEFRHRDPKSLCGFFWSYLFVLIRGVFLFTICIETFIIAPLFLLAAIAASAFGYPAFWHTDPTATPLLLLGSLVVGLALLFVLAVAVNALLHYIVEVCYSFFANQPKTEDDGNPNLLIEYIKAKKQKVCPLIEYVK